jgi:hypothetical protein
MKTFARVWDAIEDSQRFHGRPILILISANYHAQSARLPIRSYTACGEWQLTSG